MRINNNMKNTVAELVENGYRLTGVDENSVFLVCEDRESWGETVYHVTVTLNEDGSVTTKESVPDAHCNTTEDDLPADWHMDENEEIAELITSYH